MRDIVAKSDITDYLMFTTSKYWNVLSYHYLSNTKEFQVICFDNSEFFILEEDLEFYLKNRKLV